MYYLNVFINCQTTQLPLFRKVNGKGNYMLPTSQRKFTGSLIPNAPADMFMAMGLNDQKIYIIPSRNMVIVRMGQSADDKNFALSDQIRDQLIGLGIQLKDGKEGTTFSVN